MLIMMKLLKYANREISGSIIIGSYSAKYCSSFYASFRNTLNNSNSLDIKYISIRP